MAVFIFAFRFIELRTLLLVAFDPFSNSPVDHFCPLASFMTIFYSSRPPHPRGRGLRFVSVCFPCS